MHCGVQHEVDTGSDHRALYQSIDFPVLCQPSLLHKNRRNDKTWSVDLRRYQAELDVSFGSSLVGGVQHRRDTGYIEKHSLQAAERSKVDSAATYPEFLLLDRQIQK